jgi:hypothetical protein
MLRRIPSAVTCSQDRVKQAMGRLKRFKRAELEVLPSPRCPAVDAADRSAALWLTAPPNLPFVPEP